MNLLPYLSAHDISSGAELLSGLKASFSSDFSLESTIPVLFPSSNSNFAETGLVD
jgi:hypothetical protein